MLGKITHFLLVAGILVASATLSFGQTGARQLDPNQSTARLFVGSSTDPESSNFGVARVSGKATLDTNEPERSVFDLTFGADASSGPMNPDGPATAVDTPEHYADVVFKSKRVMRDSGALEVTGDLTLTRIDRSVALNPNEGYSGAEYGDPVTSTVTREVTFVFPSVDPVVAQDNKENAGRLSASAWIGRENYPELLPSLMQSNFPTLVEDESCVIPSTVGEDYAGTLCEETQIEAVTENIVPASAGEDYHGFDSVPAAGNQVTIVLNLEVSQPGL
jgi:polyisoprenoid-binding protein YceI